MMTHMVGYAIGSSVGIVQDVDDSDGQFLRIRVESDVHQPIKKGTTVTGPTGDLEVTFTFEKSPDFCFVCGVLAHQQGDCPVAVKQIMEQGFSVHQFSPNLKAESLSPKPRMAEREAASKTVDHSHRLGEGGFQMGSKSPTTSFRSLRVDGNRVRREGKQPVQAMSEIGGSESAVPSRFKNHVDSLILRSRRVAREIETDERSCEIVYDFQGIGNQRDIRQLEDVEEAVNLGKGKAKITDAEAESTDRGEEPRRHNCVICAGMPDLNEIEDAEEGEEVVDSPVLVAAKKKQIHGPLIEDELGPFIPGVGSSKGTVSEPTKLRKWKKIARVSDKYAFDSLCQSSDMQLGVKMRGVGPTPMETDGGSMAKRSKDRDEDYLPLTVEENEAAKDSEDDEELVVEIAK
ncbi:Zinc knuckle CX2CX4HX4C [Corchorus capsularis]|uniref:Zinc knuckle CX2CX4HX4C n=1 Tax=Corchorus capsularis TaxID=210143 RepID=A0A1R3J1K1_COCAP|nr:Zinc knuckle CX2CX4HX4C [Corchorus capsularis]